MNTPKRLLSGSDDVSEYSAPNTRRRSRSPNESSTTPIDHQIEQVAKRHRVPSDTVKRILSDLLSEPTVIDYLRTNLNQSGTSTENETHHDESMLSSTSYFDSPLHRSLASSQINTNPLPSLFSPNQQPTLLSTVNMVDEYDPLWLEFIQSLNKTDTNTHVQPNTTQSTIIFDSLLNDDDDDEEFIGPEDEVHTDQKKLRVSKRELALLLKDSTASPDELPSHVNEELLRGDQYESLWTDFLASLQQENNQQADEQPTSIVTSTTEDDDNDDDPEFHLPETDYDVEDDLDDGLHVSKRELALLLEDNASLLNAEEHAASKELINPESVCSTTTMTTTSSTVRRSFEHRLTQEQRHILQYQLSAYVQLLTQYILLRRETDPASSNCQSAQQLFKDLIYFRDQPVNSILAVPLLSEAQRLLESPPPSSRRRALGNHLPFHLMDTFCKSPAFLHETLLPTCLLSSTKTNLSSFFPEQTRNFVSGEDCLMALGLEQNDVKLLIIGHSDKSIRDRLDSLRYVRVRRGKQNPIKSFFTYGSMSDSSLDPWYRLPDGFDLKQIYPNGLIQKYNVVFPPWFRLSYKRSRQLSKHEQASVLSSSTINATPANDEVPSSSTVYVVVEGTSSTARSTSPKKVLQQIHMLHLLNSYPKLQPRQHGT